MKIIFQAFLASTILHAIYFLTTMAVGYVKTALYRPNMVDAWQNTETLQSEVAFGSTHSPWFHIATFLSVSFICWVILFACKKINAGTNRPEVRE
ncbi:hypothetical protein QWY15_11905 [Planococcus sp. N064]|uniref:Menaquinol-cytochrome c reductase cytochrome b subunit n=1 Tax=Planococcus liqunii TaxID=3058394 RepID=A0ABT8MSW1_9BACL|nr:hypothetical protein [Planococcus sp. N064]MDN7228003.1 hypothetical protein [Planococcus sp. N064]